MTYNVFGGTLSPTLLLLSVWAHCAIGWKCGCREDPDCITTRRLMRPPGHARITWMKTILNDLESHNLTLTAINAVQNRRLWLKSEMMMMMSSNHYCFGYITFNFCELIVDYMFHFLRFFRSTDVTSTDVVSAKGKTKEVYCCDIVGLIVLFWCFWCVKD